jgi:hypothetical protein
MNPSVMGANLLLAIRIRRKIPKTTYRGSFER